MKTLFIDMDDTICTNLFINKINQQFNEHYRLEDIEPFLVQEIIPVEKRETFMQNFFVSNMYQDCVPIKDSVSVLEELNYLYDIYIVTSYLIKGYEEKGQRMLYEKFNWLQHYFPFIASSKYIFTSNKGILKADIRIDDAIFNLSKESEMNILFTQWHNKNICQEELQEKNIIRANDWHEIRNLLINYKGGNKC